MSTKWWFGYAMFFVGYMTRAGFTAQTTNIAIYCGIVVVINVCTAFYYSNKMEKENECP